MLCAKSFLCDWCWCVEHRAAILGYTPAASSVLCKGYHSGRPAGDLTGKLDPVCSHWPASVAACHVYHSDYK